MKRILTACSVIFILFALIAGLGWKPAQAAPAAPDGTTITDTTSGTATHDGTVNTGEYVGSTSGINSGFGGVIGTGSTLYIDSSSAGVLNFGLVRGSTDFGANMMVIYIDIDSGGSGFANTGTFADNADSCREAVSGYESSSPDHQSVLTFAPGFKADYAICLQPNASYAGLFKLVSGGANSHILVGSAGYKTNGSTHYEMQLTLANLGLGPGSSFNYVATLISDTANRSNEFNGVATYTGGNPGWGDASLASGDYHTFRAATGNIVPVGNVGTGPGGVGYADGSSSLELWLIADTGEAYTDVNCTADDDDTYVADEDGESVACWLDESGNGYNVTQATESLRPAFYWDQQNLKPAIRFVGGVGGDVLTRSFAPFSGDQAYHIFAAFTPSNTNGENLFAIGSPSNNQNIAYATYNNAVSGRELYHFNDDLEVSGTVTGWQFASFGYFKFGSGTDRYYYSNGALAGSNSSNALSLPTNPTLSVGGYSNRTEDPWGNEFTGDISEMIIFSQALPDVERILVENYLSARYAIDLPYGSDHYDGDTSTNGNFDLQVAGIGWYGSDLHRQAHAVGMIVRNATFLQSDGDWLLFGNNVAMNVPTTDNRPTDGDWAGKVNSRVWTRSFYIDVTDAASNGGTVDIIFDFSEGQMGSQPAGAVANYRLLKRTGSTGQFSDITSVSGATVVIAGDQVQFLGVNVNQLGSNFTLGTLDDNTSPTSVELVDLSARPASVPLAAPILLGAAAFLTGGILAFRKLRRR